MNFGTFEYRPEVSFYDKFLEACLSNFLLNDRSFSSLSFLFPNPQSLNFIKFILRKFPLLLWKNLSSQEIVEKFFFQDICEFRHYYSVNIRHLQGILADTLIVTSVLLNMASMKQSEDDYHIWRSEEGQIIHVPYHYTRTWEIEKFWNAEFVHWFFNKACFLFTIILKPDRPWYNLRRIIIIRTPFSSGHSGVLFITIS